MKQALDSNRTTVIRTAIDLLKVFDYKTDAGIMYIIK